MTPNRKQNFQVRNKKVEEILRKTGEELKKGTPTGMGFMLMMFDYGKGGNMFYVSSAERKDVINAMNEFIIRNV